MQLICMRVLADETWHLRVVERYKHFFLVLQLRVLFAYGGDEWDAEINKDRLHLGGETCKSYQKCAIFM